MVEDARVNHLNLIGESAERIDVWERPTLSKGVSPHGTSPGV